MVDKLICGCSVQAVNGNAFLNQIQPVIDEPTPALDMETEYNFQQNIAKWAKNCTKLIIAHRLTTIHDAGYILFLDDGKIVEQGSPYDLIKKENGYLVCDA